MISSMSAPMPRRMRPWKSSTPRLPEGFGLRMESFSSLESPGPRCSDGRSAGAFNLVGDKKKILVATMSVEFCYCFPYNVTCFHSNGSS